MMSFLASCLREEYENRWEPTEDSHVLQSANKLFLRIQSSLKRCARFISKGEPLYLLARAFQVQQHPFLTLCVSLFCVSQSVLGSYSSELMKRLPKTAVGTTTLPSSFASNADWQIKLSIEDELARQNFLNTSMATGYESRSSATSPIQHRTAPQRHEHWNGPFNGISKRSTPIRFSSNRKRRRSILSRLNVFRYWSWE